MMQAATAAPGLRRGGRGSPDDIAARRNAVQSRGRPLGTCVSCERRPAVPLDQTSVRRLRLDYSLPRRTGIPAITGWDSCFTASSTREVPECLTPAPQAVTA